MRDLASEFFRRHPELSLAALGAADNARAMDLNPLGCKAQFFAAESHPELVALYRESNALAFPGELSLPGWVLSDLYLLPGAIGLLTCEARVLDIPVRKRLGLRPDDRAIAAAYLGAPTIHPGTFIGVSLLSLVPRVLAGAWVKALTLRGIFMLRRSELLWFYQEGASHIFPDAWEGFLAPIPPRERGDLMTAYYKRLTSRNRAVRKEAAKAWSVWEGTTSKLFTDPAVIKRFGGGRFADAFARIEAHYFVNKGFFEHDDQLLRNVHRLRKIPAVIVQGRYDVVCPATSAWDLHRAWPEAVLTVVEDAGHAASEPGIARALVEATDQFKVNGNFRSGDWPD